MGDLTGNGALDTVLKWSPRNAADNSSPRETSDVLFDGYTMDGEHLWRINLGRNSRAGAHYTPFLYDFDGDGKSEDVSGRRRPSGRSSSASTRPAIH